MIMKELTSDEFKLFSDNFSSHSIYQTVEYALTMSKQAFDTIYLGLFDNNNIVGATLLLIEKAKHFKYAYAPRGFLLDYKNEQLLSTFTIEIKKYLSKKNIMSIKLCPLIIKNTYDLKYNITNQNNYYDTIFSNLKKYGYYHSGYNDYFESLKPRFEAILDLTEPYYILFSNLRKKLRTKIRSAEARGVKVYKGNETNLEYLYLQTKSKYPRDLKYFEEFYKQFSNTNKIEFFYSKLDTAKYLKVSQKNFTKYEALTHKLSNQMITDNENRNKIISKKMEADLMFDKYKKQLIEATKLLREHPEGIVTASALIVKNHDEVDLLIDGYDLKYKYLNSKQLLLWKLCERYSKQGFKAFNFGGISNVNLKDNEYKGLNEFKLNFNANAVEYIGDLELVINNAQYFMYQNSHPIRNILKK